MKLKLGEDMQQIKREGASNTPTEATRRCTSHTTAVNGLQQLRDIAWHHAIKYRFDPALYEAHEKYLNLLNILLQECSA